MKFSKLSQLLLVSAIGLIVATLLTSCQIVTIDYVFVASSTGSGPGSTGQIQTYDVDSRSGALRIGQPAVPSGGTQPGCPGRRPRFIKIFTSPTRATAPWSTSPSPATAS